MSSFFVTDKLQLIAICAIINITKEKSDSDTVLIHSAVKIADERTCLICDNRKVMEISIVC